MKISFIKIQTIHLKWVNFTAYKLYLKAAKKKKKLWGDESAVRLDQILWRWLHNSANYTIKNHELYILNL